jgi:geranylgeranyl diphosphate synthase type II
MVVNMANAAQSHDAPVPLELEELRLLERIEHALELAFRTCAAGPGCPPKLAEAQSYALFPGGSRLRPQLCLVAAIACGDARPAVADAAAAAIELLHCASLVHDDLPCFDDADTRRGKPSVHKVFGEPLALLVGDAFIVHSFDVLVRSAAAPREIAELLQTLAAAAGSTRGILAGQAWESEPVAPLDEYQRAKTASLFEAAAAMGAIAAGASPHPWRRFGEALGRAYQAADDLNDVIGDARALGKPTGRDAVLGRPSVVRALGVDAARVRLRSLVDDAVGEIPRCERERLVRTWFASMWIRVGLR